MLFLTMADLITYTFLVFAVSATTYVALLMIYYAVCFAVGLRMESWTLTPYSELNWTDDPVAKFLVALINVPKYLSIGSGCTFLGLWVLWFGFLNGWLVPLGG